ncbi:MAG TPA: MBL fold metallo-hydrolase, partial [Candidatus Angelobacter sp.]
MVRAAWKTWSFSHSHPLKRLRRVSNWLNASSCVCAFSQATARILVSLEKLMRLNGIKVTWLGHATFLLETPGGKHVLIDPWVTQNPSTPADRKSFQKID